MVEHQFLHKFINLPCTLEVGGHFFFRGETRELSEHEATVQIPALAFSGAQKPRHGMNCMLILNVNSLGARLPETLKIPCRVSYTATILIGLNLNIEAVDNRQREIFDELLQANK